GQWPPLGQPELAAGDDHCTSPHRHSLHSVRAPVDLRVEERRPVDLLALADLDAGAIRDPAVSREMNRERTRGRTGGRVLADPHADPEHPSLEARALAGEAVGANRSEP